MESPQVPLLNNATDAYNEILQKLIEDGLNPESNDPEKLLFLWKIYLHLKDELQTARDIEQKLKETQTEEMKEVENYVEHIRHLSDEREALIQELETENEALKAQVAILEQGNNEVVRAEITEMLTQQGLEEISNALQSEQIAYLLMERARLLDEVDERASNSNNGDQTNNAAISSDTELKNLLERERKESEDELKHQRENARMSSDQLKQEHEEEISALIDENNKLEDDLQKSEMMVSQLKAELSKYTDGDDGNSNFNQSLKAGSDDEKRKLFEERNEINREREELENEMEEVEKDRADFNKEKDQFNQEKAAFEREKEDITEKESQTLTQKLLESEKNKNNLTQEGHVKEKEGEKESTKTSLSRSGSLSRSPSDLTVRRIIEEKTKVETEVVQLKAQLRAIQKEKDTHDDVVSKLKDDLEKSHMQQQQLQVRNRSLKTELQELEDQLENTETNMDLITKEKLNLSEKYETLNSEAKTLRTDAMKFYTLQDIVEILNNDKKQLSQSLESLKSKMEQAESEKTELANENKSLSKGEQDLTNQLRACKQELEKVIGEKNHIGSDKQELLSVIKKHEEVERNLQADLADAVKMKEKCAHQVETLSKENKDLLNKLDRSREELESTKLQLLELAKQEIVLEHLKEQNQQLQNQVIVSRDDLAKSRDRETMLVSTQQALQKSHDGSERRYVCEIDDLKLKLELTLQELAKSKCAIEELNKEKGIGREHMKKLQQALEDNATLKKALANQVPKEEHIKLKEELVKEKAASEESKKAMQLLGEKFEEEINLRTELTKKITLANQVTVEEHTKLKEELVKEKAASEESKKAMQLLSEKFEAERNLRTELTKKITLTNQVTEEEHTKLKEELVKEKAVSEESKKAMQLLSEKFEAERNLRTELTKKITLVNQVTEEEHTKLKEELVKEKAVSEESKKAMQLLSEKFEEEKNLRTELTKKITLANQVTEEEHTKLKEELVKEKAASEESKKAMQLLSEKFEEEINLRTELTKKVTLANQLTEEEHAKLKEVLVKEKAASKESKMAMKLLREKFDEEKNLRAALTKQVEEKSSAGSEHTSTVTLKVALDELEQERSARADCDLRLKEIEQLLEDQKVDSDYLHHSLSEKIMSLEKQVQALQDDLYTAQDELQSFQDKYDKAVKEAEIAKTEVISQHKVRDTMAVQTSGKMVPTRQSQRKEDLDVPLHPSSTKLQETLNELNTVKSRLCQTQEELESSRTEVNVCRRDIELLKQSLNTATKQAELSDEKIKSLRHELVETHGTLQLTQNQLLEKQTKVDSLIEEKNKVQRELDTTHEQLVQQTVRRPIDPAIYGEKERQMHIDKASMLEKLSQQFELDNRELTRKLSDIQRKCETLEEQLQKEKLRNADKYQQINKYTSQREKDINTANNHIRHLREELQKHQAKSFRLEADNIGLTAKYQSTISRLEQDIKDIKQRHGQELTSLRERMGSSSTDFADLREQKTELEQELSHLKLDLSRSKSENERLEKHLQAESRLKIDLENRNSVIDSEIAKAWSQVRSLMEKNTELEATNHSLEHNLSLTKSTLKHTETTLTQKEAVHEASTKNILTKAELSERKTFEEYGNASHLQKQFEEVTDKMLNVERQLAQADLGSVQHQDTKDTLLAVKHQLEGEKLQRSILDHTVAELKHQVALLKQREATVVTENKELQHTILDLESHLSMLQDQSNVDFSMHKHISDMSKDSLLDQISRLQREVKELQHELYNLSERRDVDMKRYEERKLRTKEKLMKARTLYTAERSRYMEQMKNMGEDLRLTQATLIKEKEWGNKMDESYKMLLSEKRDLISQLSEVDETLRDKVRTLSMMQAKITYLEEENSRLQSQLQEITEQKHYLSKQLQNHGKRETSFTIPPLDLSTRRNEFGSKHEMEFDSDSQHDAMSPTWLAHIDPPASFRRSSISGVGSYGDGVGGGSNERREDRIVLHVTDINREDGGTSGLRTTADYKQTGSRYSYLTNFDDQDEFEV